MCPKELVSNESVQLFERVSMRCFAYSAYNQGLQLVLSEKISQATSSSALHNSFLFVSLPAVLYDYVFYSFDEAADLFFLQALHQLLLPMSSNCIRKHVFVWDIPDVQKNAVLVIGDCHYL